MKKTLFLLAAAPLAFATPAAAQEGPSQDEAIQGGEPAAAKEVFSTGVAKGRDILDSAISTSSLKEGEIQKFGARSLAEILRNIPGIRTESSTGEGNSNYTIRGLPLASGGSKYMQIEEDGLPVLEFGDVFNMASDIFIRADFNLAAIEAIRGGSASTFASNSPGGVINLISDTGTVEGGAVQATTGVDYGETRLDFGYGGRLSDSVRFHIGGFYRVGEGPRDIGFTGYKGGQLKFNVTKEFTGGYVRFYAKYLDDRSPQYSYTPVRITGTNDKPVYESFPNFDIRSDASLSPYIASLVTLDGRNQPEAYPVSDGISAKASSVGIEARFDLGGWTVTEKARYSKMSGSTTRNQISSAFLGSAPTAAYAGGTFSYATGPNAGQAIASPGTINGNGLIGSMLLVRVNANALDNFTNDLRASRVWKLGAGDFTFTSGVYKATQKLDTNWLYTNTLQSFVGDGGSALLDYTTAGGVKNTQNGVQAYNLSTGAQVYRRAFDVEYDITAPYGSVNYHIGKLAIGASVRYDTGKVSGQLFGADLGGGRVGLISYDFDGNGTISVPESKTAVIPLDRPAPVDYSYHYLSYSTGINFRVSEPFAVFARYSKGARASADKILFTPAVSYTDGSMADKSNAYDAVKQTEVGFKFRKPNMSVNVTGFLADTTDHNIQGGTGLQTLRNYRAYGAELEASFRHGPFSVNGGATWTHAEIVSDQLVTTVNGNVPRHQPKFMYAVTPQYDGGMFTIGANVTGVTKSFAQDTNGLVMPGYTLVGAFAQIRPMENVQLMLNVNNLFDKVAYFELIQSAVPANNLGWGRAANGRTISASLRFDF